MPRPPLQPALFAAFLFLALPGFAGAAESITRWHSAVEVNADGSLLVREELRVNAEGVALNHGIERDFPLRFTDWRGQPRTASFEIQRVTLDGQPVPYELIPVDNGVRARIGSADKTLAPGSHEFVLAYTSGHQLYTEEGGGGLLYWNVTGNAWELPIDHVSCTVSLPRALARDEARLECFTGLAGATAQDASAALRDGKAVYAARKPLPAGWGLTAVLHFPAGIVQLEDAGAGAAPPSVNGMQPLSQAPAAPSRTGGMPQWLMESWPVILVLLWLTFKGLRGGGGGPDSGYRAYRDTTYRSSGSSSSGGFSGRSGGGGGGGGGRGW